MAMIPNRKKPIVGAKYRACSWRSIINGKPEIVGYGLEEKKIGQSRYALVAWHDDAVPFATRAEARNKAKQLNEQASAAAQKGKHDHRPNHRPTNPRRGA